jgi:hypothetical protein
MVSLSDRSDLAQMRMDINSNAASLQTHEAVCAERQGEIKEKLRNIERIIWSTALGVIATLLASVGSLIIRFLPAH